MAIVLNCGFECSSTLDKWSVSSAATTIQTSTVRTGARSLRSNTAAASSYAQHFLNVAQTTSVLRFYARWASLPNTATDTRFLLGIVSAGNQPQLMTDSGGVVTFGINTGTQVVHPTTVVTGRWYRFDVRVLNNDGSGVKKIDVQVDGVSTTQATLTEAGANVTAWRIGNPTSAITTDIFIDDFIVGDATGDYPIGEGQCDTLFVTADGTHSFTAGDFGDQAGTILSSTTTANTSLNKTLMPAAGATLSASFLEQIVIRGTGYLEFIFDVAAVTGDIKALTFVFSTQAETAASTNSFININDNGTISSATTFGASVVAVTTMRHAYKTLAIRPSTSTAWTPASMATLRARWGFSTDAAPDVRTDCIIIEIDQLPRPPYVSPYPPLLAQ